MTCIESLLAQSSEEVVDAEEDACNVFANLPHGQDLGMLSAKAPQLELHVGGRDLVLTQSPGILVSDREHGTTGSVVWSAAPRLAEWLSADVCFLNKTHMFGADARVLELGCGSSGLLAIMLSGKVGQYIATDQHYVMRLLKRNIEDNMVSPAGSARHRQEHILRRHQTMEKHEPSILGNIKLMPLDWELDDASDLSRILQGPGSGLDAVLASDCVYNEGLVEPFVQTCAALCALRGSDNSQPTLCVVAQQLRSQDVYELWVNAMLRHFHLLELGEQSVPQALSPTMGFVVHVGVIRDAFRK